MLLLHVISACLYYFLFRSTYQHPANSPLSVGNVNVDVESVADIEKSVRCTCCESEKGEWEQLEVTYPTVERELLESLNETMKRALDNVKEMRESRLKWEEAHLIPSEEVKRT